MLIWLYRIQGILPSYCLNVYYCARAALLLASQLFNVQSTNLSVILREVSPVERAVDPSDLKQLASPRAASARKHMRACVFMHVRTYANAHATTLRIPKSRGVATGVARPVRFADFTGHYKQHAHGRARAPAPPQDHHRRTYALNSGKRRSPLLEFKFIVLILLQFFLLPVGIAVA